MKATKNRVQIPENELPMFVKNHLKSMSSEKREELLNLLKKDSKERIGFFD